ncbi:unnamed protein product [Sphagnum tenellum]
MELLALNASIGSPLDACSSRSARVAASSSWLPHELECFRSPQQQPGRGGRGLGGGVLLKNLKFSHQLQFRGGRQRQQRRLRSRRMIVCCEAAADFDDAKKTQSAQLYSQIERGFIVIATPFASGFDHLRIADETQFKFDRCIRSLRDDLVNQHSMFGPSAEIAVQQLKQFESVSPPIVKQVLPLIEQLPPLYVDLANGKDQFVPTPDETDHLIKTSYGIGENLLIKFKEDQIDETPRLAQTLSSNSAVSGFLDMSVRVLPGDHARLLLQVFPVVPPNMARTINRGSELSSTMAAGTPSAEIAKGLCSNPTAQRLSKEVIENIESLIDEIASWMTASA